jgi:hypothetical protein
MHLNYPIHVLKILSALAALVHAGGVEFPCRPLNC